VANIAEVPFFVSLKLLTLLSRPFAFIGLPRLPTGFWDRRCLSLPPKAEDRLVQPRHSGEVETFELKMFHEQLPLPVPCSCSSPCRHGAWTISSSADEISLS